MCSFAVGMYALAGGTQREDKVLVGTREIYFLFVFAWTGFGHVLANPIEGEDISIVDLDNTIRGAVARKNLAVNSFVVRRLNLAVNRSGGESYT